MKRGWWFTLGVLAVGAFRLAQIVATSRGAWVRGDVGWWVVEVGMWATGFVLALGVVGSVERAHARAALVEAELELHGKHLDAIRETAVLAQLELQLQGGGDDRMEEVS